MHKNYIIVIAFAFIFFLTQKATAQSTDSTSHFSITGYVDAYYAYYTDSLERHAFQQFPSVSPRSNQFGLNTAMVTAQYDADKVRAIVSLHYGDIPLSSWSGTYNPIMEAHAGIRLCKKLWVDAGFFRTHVGTEGLLPKENIASSISINTWYEPYFESGVRFNYTPNDKLVINLFILNGYNMFEDNNNKKSLGLLVNYTFNDKLSIGYSDYLGDDAAMDDKKSRLRFHNNLFLNYQSKKLKVQAGGDICMQQHAAYANHTSDTEGAWMGSGVLSIKYLCCKQTSVYTRGEIFNDPQGFMSGLIDGEKYRKGLLIYGFTLGVEYKPTDNSYIRLEGRDLIADKDQKIFYWNKKQTNTRIETMISIGVSF